MPDSDVAIDRREALRRTALLLGASISAPALAGILAGCDMPRAEAAWRPRVLTDGRDELVATIAEHILPETGTPGARSVGVHRFIDTMLAEHYSAADRERFLDGLKDVDARARQTGATRFLGASKNQQLGILSEVDHDAYPPGAPAAAASAPRHFFRTMKELTLLGYYTSEIGATRELQYNPVPGRFEGCVPAARIGRAWAV